MSQISRDEAFTNVYSWFDWLGIDWVDSIFRQPEADRYALVIGLLILTGSAVALSHTRYFSNPKQGKDAEIDEEKEKPGIPDLNKCFETDFSNCLRTTGSYNMSLFSGVEIRCSLNSDSSSGSKFYSFYIPRDSRTAEICHYLPQGINDDLFTHKDAMRFELKQPGDHVSIKSEDLILSKAVYIYHETDLSLQEMADITERFKQAGLNVHLRGSNYATTSWMQNRIN